MQLIVLVIPQDNVLSVHAGKTSLTKDFSTQVNPPSMYFCDNFWRLVMYIPAHPSACLSS
jgi:hypothetical protein